MIRRVLPCSVVVLLGLIALAWSAPDPKVEDSPQVKERKQIRDLQEKLAGTITEAIMIDPNTPLKEALEYFGDKFGMTILIDTEAFRADDEAVRIEDAPVRLPKMQNVSRGLILRLLLSQLRPAGGYRVRPGYLEVTTAKRLWPGNWADLERPQVPTLDLVLDKRPLEEALRELADNNDLNILVDTRVAEKAKKPVTARLRGVPIDTAVRLLTDMADLKSVVVDNVIYVTSKANAAALQGGDGLDILDPALGGKKSAAPAGPTEPKKPESEPKP